MNSFTINNISIAEGSKIIPQINITPSNTLWSESEDFLYSGYDSSKITQYKNEGALKLSLNTKGYSTQIIATHKVTGKTTTFNINVINQRAALLGLPVNQFGYDTQSWIGTVQPHISNLGISGFDTFYGWVDWNKVASYLDGDARGIFIAMGHGDKYKKTDHTFMIINNQYSEDEREEMIANGITPPDEEFPSHALQSKYTFNIDGETVRKNLDLSNMKLAIYVSCRSGAGGEQDNNLPNLTVQQGAITSIGFDDVVNCSLVDDWLNDLFDLLNEGETVEEACSKLNGRYLGVSSPVICGLKSQTF